MCKNEIYFILILISDNKTLYLSGDFKLIDFDLSECFTKADEFWDVLQFDHKLNRIFNLYLLYRNIVTNL